MGGGKVEAPKRRRTTKTTNLYQAGRFSLASDASQSANCPGLCAPGRFGSGGDTASSCTGQCNAGRFGGQAETEAACSGVCPPGTFGSGGSVDSACSGSCLAGRYGALGGQTSSNCQGSCDPGYYCLAGSTSKTATPCPAGRWGGTGGHQTNLCQGEVSPGHWSGTGATTSTPNKCLAGYWGGSGSSSSTCLGKVCLLSFHPSPRPPSFSHIFTDYRKHSAPPATTAPKVQRSLTRCRPPPSSAEVGKQIQRHGSVPRAPLHQHRSPTGITQSTQTDRQLSAKRGRGRRRSSQGLVTTQPWVS